MKSTAHIQRSLYLSQIISKKIKVKLMGLPFCPSRHEIVVVADCWLLLLIDSKLVEGVGGGGKGEEEQRGGDNGGWDLQATDGQEGVSEGRPPKLSSSPPHLRPSHWQGSSSSFYFLLHLCMTLSKPLIVSRRICQVRSVGFRVCMQSFSYIYILSVANLLVLWVATGMEAWVARIVFFLVFFLIFFVFCCCC